MRVKTGKVAQFSLEDQELARMAKTLAHPARIAILRTLAARKTCVCGELVNELPLAQSTVSQHLRELRENGLIQGETEGPNSCYCINRENLQNLFLKLGQLEREIAFFDETSRSCCSEDCLDELEECP